MKSYHFDFTYQLKFEIYKSMFPRPENITNRDMNCFFYPEKDNNPGFDGAFILQIPNNNRNILIVFQDKYSSEKLSNDDENIKWQSDVIDSYQNTLLFLSQFGWNRNQIVLILRCWKNSSKMRLDTKAKLDSKTDNVIICNKTSLMKRFGRPLKKMLALLKDLAAPTLSPNVKAIRKNIFNSKYMYDDNLEDYYHEVEDEGESDIHHEAHNFSYP